MNQKDFLKLQNGDLVKVKHTGDIFKFVKFIEVQNADRITFEPVGKKYLEAHCVALPEYEYDRKDYVRDKVMLIKEGYYFGNKDLIKI